MPTLFALMVAGVVACLFKPMLYMKVAWLPSRRQAVRAKLFAYKPAELVFMGALFASLLALLIEPNTLTMVCAASSGLGYLLYVGRSWWPWISRWPDEVD